MEQEYSELLAQANRELAVYGEISQNTQQALLDAQTGVKDFSQRVAGPAKKAVSDLGAVVGRTATAMYRGEKGLKAFDGALDSASSAADSASKALFAIGGPLGLFLGAITFLIGKAVKATKVVNEQLDKQYDAFQTLSQSGLTASDGLTGLFSDMQKMRVNVLDAGSYLELMSGASRELATFGGTAFEGRSRLAEVNVGLDDFQQGMAQLGMTEDDRRDALMGFIKIEQQNFRTQGRTALELADGAKAYIKEQAALTRVTGVDRKTREKMRQDELQEESYQASLQDLRNRGLGDQAKNLENANKLLADSLPQTAKALRALQSGNLTSAESQKLFGMGLADVQALQEQVRKGTLSDVEYAKLIAQRVVEYSDRQGTQQALFEQNDAIAISYAEQQQARAVLLSGQFDQYKKAQTDVADQTAGQMDDMTKNMAAANNAITQSTLSLQATVQKAAPLAAAAMRKFAETAAKAAGMIAGQKPVAEMTQPELAVASGAQAGKDFAADATQPVKPRPNDPLRAQQWDAKYASGWNPDGSSKSQTPKPAAAPAPKAQASPTPVVNSAILVANQPVLPGKPLTPVQMSAVDLSISMGNVPHPQVKEAYDLTKKINAEPKKTNSQTGQGDKGTDTANQAAQLPKINTRTPPAAAAPQEQSNKPITDMVQFSSASGSKENFEYLSADFQSRILQAVAAYQAQGGGKLQLTSAFRSDQDQERLYKKWQEAGGGPTQPTAAGITTPALPVSLGGQGSAHNRGSAVDASNAADVNSRIRLADFGLEWGGNYRRSDPVHIAIKAADGGVFAAKPGGQHVLLAEAGQDEAVIPMKNGAVQVSMRDSAVLQDVSRPDDSMSMVTNLVDSMSTDITENLQSVIQDIVNKLQPPQPNKVFNAEILAQLDQLIVMQRQANDIDSRMLAVAAN